MGDKKKSKLSTEHKIKSWIIKTFKFVLFVWVYRIGMEMKILAKWKKKLFHNIDLTENFLVDFANFYSKQAETIIYLHIFFDNQL